MLECGSNTESDNEFDISVEDEALFHSIADKLDHESALAASPAPDLRLSADASGATLSLHQPRRGVDSQPLPIPATPINYQLRASNRQLGNEGRGESEEQIADRLESKGRTPIQQFRTAPKRPLAVTDLSSAEWCELQFEYTLRKLPYGRRVPTAAMKGGSKVHQKLEREVHVPVKVVTVTREDSFSVRLWNIVQGLRTLRETGITRELEVWGMVDGNVVNGVIDQLTVEDELADVEVKGKDEPNTDRMVFITDAKTRGSRKAPAWINQKPTVIQLYLYQRFLCDLADGKVDLFTIIKRYRMDPDAVLSDSYIAQIGQLHADIFDKSRPSSTSPDNKAPAPTSESSPLAPAEPITDANKVVDREADETTVVRYRTLREMVPLIQDELRKTFPRGSATISKYATVEYRFRETGEVISVVVLELDEAELQPKVDSYMEWWRGEREARGVPVEESFKCNICSFAESCTWRQKMDEEMLARAEVKAETRRRLQEMKDRPQSNWETLVNP